MAWKEKIRRWCARSERSRQEALDKILKEAGPDIKAAEFLKTLETEGFISQPRFISAFTHDHFYLKRWGPRKIIDGLLSKGCTLSESQSEVDKIPAKEVETMLKDVIKSRLSLYPGEDKNNKPKLIRYLQGRGYDLEVILSVV